MKEGEREEGREGMMMSGNICLSIKIWTHINNISLSGKSMMSSHTHTHFQMDTPTKQSDRVRVLIGILAVRAPSVCRAGLLINDSCRFVCDFLRHLGEETLREQDEGAKGDEDG